MKNTGVSCDFMSDYFIAGIASYHIIHNSVNADVFDEHSLQILICKRLIIQKHFNTDRHKSGPLSDYYSGLIF